MKFLDQAKVYVRSGNGGAGSVSFRRENSSNTAARTVETVGAGAMCSSRPPTASTH
jgi:GTPase involved in cell partitioning and DNA repair